MMIEADQTNVFPRLLDLAYPSVERGDGVRLYTTDGLELLDACSGGAMAACLGHGATEIVNAARAQAERISYVYNHHFTNEPQERLAERLIEVAAPEMARVRFVSGGSEANETALRLIRQYHVDRGEEGRWRIISQAQAYHGALMGRSRSRVDAPCNSPTTSTCRNSCTSRRRRGALIPPARQRWTNSIACSGSPVRTPLRLSSVSR